LEVTTAFFSRICFSAASAGGLLASFVLAGAVGPGVLNKTRHSLHIAATNKKIK